MRSLVYRLAQLPKSSRRSLYPPRSSPLFARFIKARQFHASTMMSSPAKRKAEKDISPPKPKKTKTKTELPAYHLTPSRQDESGENVWPARKEQIERAREIIREWYITTQLIDEYVDTNVPQCRSAKTDCYSTGQGCGWAFLWRYTTSHSHRARLIV